MACFCQDVIERFDALLELCWVSGVRSEGVRDEEDGEVESEYAESLDKVDAKVKVYLVGAEGESAACMGE
jgi:hypothetical protein